MIDRPSACELVQVAVRAGLQRARVTVNKDHNIGTPVRVSADWGNGYHRSITAPEILDNEEKIASFVGHAIKELRAWYERRTAGSMDP